MKDGQVWGRAGIAIVTALIMCMMGAGAYAISPEQYRSALAEKVAQERVKLLPALNSGLWLSAGSAPTFP